ncbi:craniofacial development protein 2-like [Orbicella faveolata]|uniref:craniofacial development protein 2-like n=1 Tax=Orbicella faveolata TaxID=48498 RepID=UPI0009E393CA|nr:craniofacial development protein 2-like [Orbicella faveolata]
MKSSSECLRYLEATRRNCLSLSRDTTKGTWNVMTMFQSGKAAEIAAEMQTYNTAMLGISETRWTQFGLKRLISGEMILFSGHEEEDALHTESVALILSRSAQKALIVWKSHGPRIIKAAFRTKQKKIKVSIIQRYAPTNDSDEEDKHEF